MRKTPFHPYFSWKDLAGFLALGLVLVSLGFFYPTLLGDPENFIPANPIVTPVHIQPEWYFLFAYAILRSIPSKLGGVVALGMSVAIFYFLPLGGSKIATPSAFTPPYQVAFWFFITFFIILT